jgi:hypothetical protein
MKREDASVNDAAVQRLMDENACAGLLARYGQAVDRLDVVALERLFWPDATIDLGFFKGSGQQAADFLVTNGRLSLRRCHVTCNSVFEFAGASVNADSCAITHAISSDGVCGMLRHVFFGRYLDRIERRGGEWRLAARRHQLHSYTVAPYAEDPTLVAMAATEIDGELA